jgi:hypothetical protein
LFSVSVIPHRSRTCEKIESSNLSYHIPVSPCPCRHPGEKCHSFDHERRIIQGKLLRSQRVCSHPEDLIHFHMLFPHGWCTLATGSLLNTAHSEEALKSNLLSHDIAVDGFFFCTGLMQNGGSIIAQERESRLTSLFSRR